jgi:hypothetical protein
MTKTPAAAARARHQEVSLMSRKITSVIAVALAVGAATFGSHHAHARGGGGGGGGGGGFSGGGHAFAAAGIGQAHVNTFSRVAVIHAFPHNPDRVVRSNLIRRSYRPAIHPLVSYVGLNLGGPRLVLPRVLPLPPRQLTPQGYPGGSLGLRISAGGYVDGGNVDCGPRNCVPKDPGRVFAHDGGGTVRYLGPVYRYQPPGHYADSNNNGGCVGNVQCGMPSQSGGPPSGGPIDNGSAGVPAGN